MGDVSKCERKIKGTTYVGVEDYDNSDEANVKLKELRATKAKCFKVKMPTGYRVFVGVINATPTE